MMNEQRTVIKELKSLVENLAVQNSVPFECYTYNVEIRRGFLVVEYTEQPSKKVRK